jgi:hypothetical protein
MQLVRARSYTAVKVIYVSVLPLLSGYQVFATQFQLAQR